MKKLILLLLVITLMQQASAQQLTSYDKPQERATPELEDVRKEKESKNEELNIKLKERQSIKVKRIQELKGLDKDMKGRISTSQDSINIEKKKEEVEANSIAALQVNDRDVRDLKKNIDSLDNAAREEKILSKLKSLKEAPNFSVVGVGGVSGIEKLSNTGGNLSVALNYRLGDYKRINDSSKWLDPFTIYMGFNTRTASSDDTGNLAKTFLFPDISKRDFVIGAHFSFLNALSGWSIQPTIEFSLNRYKIVKEDTASKTTTSKSFTSESALVGVKFLYLKEFSVSDATYETGFYLYPYYNIINVQPKNAENYREMLGRTDEAGNKDLPLTVHALGMQMGFLLSKVQMFANVKYFVNKEHDGYPTDFKGMTYTIGTVIGVDVLRFRL